MKINWDFKIILSSDRSVAKNKGHHSFTVVIPENEELSWFSFQNTLHVTAHFLHLESRLGDKRGRLSLSMHECSEHLPKSI